MLQNSTTLSARRVQSLWKSTGQVKHCRACHPLGLFGYDYKAVQLSEKHAMQTFSIDTDRIVDTIIVKVMNITLKQF